MADSDPHDADAMRARLDKLSTSLDARRASEDSDVERQTAKSTDSGFGRGMSMALRAVSELVAGIVLGGAIGWGLDRLFHTKPLFLILLGLLGTAGGFWNIIRETSPKGRVAAVDFSERLDASRRRSDQGD